MRAEFYEEDKQQPEERVVPSKEEHLRQHSERLTGADRQNEDVVSSLSEPSPQTEHLISADHEQSANY
jgi:hypothetical protein